MNILAIGILPPKFSGAALTNAEIINGLVSKGHYIQIISDTSKASTFADDSYVNSLIYENIITRINQGFPPAPEKPHFRQSDLISGELTRAIEYKLNNNKPDLFFVLHEAMFWYIPDWFFGLGIPTIVVCHGFPTTMLANEYSENERAAFLKRLRRADTIITVAEHLRDILNRFGILNVKTVPNGINIEYLTRNEKRCSYTKDNTISNRYTFTHISNLKKAKNAIQIISCAKDNRMRDLQIEFSIIGDGPYKKEMQDDTAVNKLERMINFLGQVPYSRIFEILQNSYGFISCSKYEGCPRVIMEAQSAGCVVIATDIPAHRELIHNGRNGLLYKEGDLDDMVEKIRFSIEEGFRNTIAEEIDSLRRQYDIKRQVDAINDEIVRLTK